MIARFFFVSFSLAVLATGAHAQTAVGKIPPDTSTPQFRSPLYHNINTAGAPPTSTQSRCQQYRAAIDDSYRPATPDQVRATDLMSDDDISMRAYNQRSDAEKAYRDAHCD